MYNQKVVYAHKSNYMKTIIAFLFSLSTVGALPPVDSTYWAKLNSEQKTILKKYVQENKSFGLSKQNTVLLVWILTPYGNPDAYELQIGATNREDIFLREEPAYGSEIDGYPVALFIGWNLSSIIQFPKNHSDFIKKYFLSKVEKKPKPKVIYTRRNAKGEILPIPKLVDDRPLEKYEDWNVVLKKGEKPIIKKLL